MPFAICITKCIPAGIRAGETLGIPRVLEWGMAHSRGFEPLTSAFGGQRIISLDADFLDHWSLSGANLQHCFALIDRGVKNREPQRCKDGALKFFLNKFVMLKDLKKYIGPTSKVAAEVGLKVARRTTKAFSNFAKSNPEEAKSTIIGTSAGAGIGFAIGGSIGVVGFFGGIGIPWIVLMALSGGALGNRLGIGRDKAKINEKRREQAKRFHEILDQYESAKSKTEQKAVRKKIEVLSSHKQHRDTLIHALDSANERVIILCGWATSYVIDIEFQRLLAKALKRGVSVYLGYGYQSASEPAPLKKHEIEAEENLLALREWCADKDTDGVLVVKKFPNHSKILICDDAYAVNGSFNWLSNAGRSRNIERSWLIKDKEFINAEIELILSELARHVNKRDFLKNFVPWSRH